MTFETILTATLVPGVVAALITFGANIYLQKRLYKWNAKYKIYMEVYDFILERQEASLQPNSAIVNRRLAYNRNKLSFFCSQEAIDCFDLMIVQWENEYSGNGTETVHQATRGQNIQDYIAIAKRDLGTENWFW